MSVVPHPISAVIITLNEENMIKDCLISLQKCVDEIIIIDSGSTDKTVAICEEMRAKVFTKEWLGYSETKNYGNMKASNDLIFSIDADERVDKKLMRSLQKVREKGLNGVGKMKRKNHYGSHWVRFGGWYPDWKKRLFDRNKVKWKGDYVHEELFSGEMEVIPLQGNILHYTVANREHHQKTIHKYARLNADRMFDLKKKPNALASMFSSIWTFIKIYFIKLGFLDGVVGVNVALGSAQSKWLRYRYVKEKYLTHS